MTVRFVWFRKVMLLFIFRRDVRCKYVPHPIAPCEDPRLHQTVGHTLCVQHRHVLLSVLKRDLHGKESDAPRTMSAKYRHPADDQSQTPSTETIETLLCVFNQSPDAQRHPYAKRRCLVSCSSSHFFLHAPLAYFPHVEASDSTADDGTMR